MGRKQFSGNLESEEEPRRSINHPRIVSSDGGGMCPEQHFGYLDDGQAFYFRMRGGWAQLHVAPPGTNMCDLPLTNPEFSWEEAKAHDERGEEYPHRFFKEPIGQWDVYPGDNLTGWFLTDEDRDRTFARCLEQIEEYQRS